MKTAIIASALALSSLAGGTLVAQTNTNAAPVSLWLSSDAGVGKDAKATAAQNALDDPASPQPLKRSAALYLLRAGGIPADAAVADPSLGGKITDTAFRAELECVARVTKAERLLKSGDYAGTINLMATEGMLGREPYAYRLIATAKRLSSAEDALSWAKASFAVLPFSKTGTGANTVNAALLAKSGNLGEANKFIAYMGSGTGANPLAGVDYPAAAKRLTNFSSDTMAVYGDIFKGKNREAVQRAVSLFSGFDNPAAVNAHVDLVASLLRDIDGNVVRANAYVEAQKDGKPFTLSELQ